MISFLDTIFGDIAFDAVISENTNASSVVTSNPIETGAAINDHIYANPKIYDMFAGVSNSPLSELNGDIFTSSGHPGDANSGGRRASAWDILNQIHVAGELFDVNTGLETLSNMVLVSLTAGNDADTSGALLFSATLMQVILVSTEESQLTADQLKDEATKLKATPNASKGKVNKTPVTDASISLRIAEWFGALSGEQ